MTHTKPVLACYAPPSPPSAGGALQATPKRIQLLMAVPGLSLLHVKSHLQVGKCPTLPNFA